MSRPTGSYQAQPVPRNIRLKLDANEGPSPDAAWLERVLSGISSDIIRQYPDSTSLAGLLAELHGVTVDRILITAGGDEAIERLCRVAIGPSRPLIVPTPTFEMIERYASLRDAPVRGIPWADDAPFPMADVRRSLSHQPGLLALVTPNNPTGRAIPREMAAELCRDAPCPVMLDLAYAEFADDDLTDLAIAVPGVVAIRTFSKAWSLAGLRVGYALGDAELIARMRASGGPYSVASVSQSVVAAAVRTKAEVMRAAVAAIRHNRSQLSAELRAMGFAVADSQANFVLARHPRADAVWAALRDAGVLVRRWSDRPGLLDALRITCPPDQASLDMLLGAVQNAMDHIGTQLETQL